MEKRITEKLVTIRDTEYRIKKLDARSAVHLAFQLKSFMPQTDDAGEIIESARSNMNKRDFFALENDLLSACYHVMPADKKGEICVIDERNNFVMEDLAKDPVTVSLLMIHSLIFNVMDFFDESFLKAFAPITRDISQLMSTRKKTS